MRNRHEIAPIATAGGRTRRIEAQVCFICESVLSLKIRFYDTPHLTPFACVFSSFCHAGVVRALQRLLTTEKVNP
ncbi:hypothetical protein EM6_2262 [Asticcacaulis excentricus]|uniref:Uncharacterized protein n=1 Tax=Asticcacaulis excentricus TaxID=78587 RepID=A0A3G9G2V9_9CAUL|nr:hypothetical protein EM6_2262 [Asticcacaulis excentricus]